MAKSLVSAPIVEQALAAAAMRQERHEHLWRMSRVQRVAAFYRGELSLADCLAWAGRYPKEPPIAADGEYMFIAALTPDWADAPTRRTVSRGAGREP